MVQLDVLALRLVQQLEDDVLGIEAGLQEALMGPLLSGPHELVEAVLADHPLLAPCDFEVS